MIPITPDTDEGVEYDTTPEVRGDALANEMFDRWFAAHQEEIFREVHRRMMKELVWGVRE